MTAEEIRKLPISTDIPKKAESAPLGVVFQLVQANLLLREIAAQLAELNANFTGSPHGALAVTVYGSHER